MAASVALVVGVAVGAGRHVPAACENEVVWEQEQPPVVGGLVVAGQLLVQDDPVTPLSAWTLEFAPVRSGLGRLAGTWTLQDPLWCRVLRGKRAKYRQGVGQENQGSKSVKLLGVSDWSNFTAFAVMFTVKTICSPYSVLPSPCLL